MNKHIHRLVFDRHRGMRVPAAEHTRSAGKAAGGQTRAVAASVSALTVLLGQAGQVAEAEVLSAKPVIQSAMGTANSPSAMAVPPAFSAARSVSGMVSQVLASGRPNLPVLSTTFAGDNKGLFTVQNPSSDDLYLMKVLQDSGAIVVNWDSFNIGKGYTVQFVQPTGGRALNKVRNGGPSLIDGVLKGNGEVMVENGAGIIFGKNARVNTGSLVATALSVTQSALDNAAKDAADTLKNPDDPGALNLYGLRAGQAAFAGSESDTRGFVAVERGAVIQSADGGKVIMVAPRVVNKGLIETPRGNTVLAAGKTVYLFAPTDLAQRGLIVSVDNFSDSTLQQIEAQVRAENGLSATDPLPADVSALGTVENVREGGTVTSGLVRADRGTINLVGAAIRQKGQLTATTAVKGENGAIFLRAMKDTFVVANGGSGEAYREARNLGTVELGADSITEVLPSVAGLLTADGKAAASSLVEAVVVAENTAAEQAAGQPAVSDVTLNKIGVRPDEVLRAAPTLDEPVRPTVPAGDASDEVKAKYAADLAKFEADKRAYDAAERTVQRASDVFYRSRIDVLGSDIVMRSGAKLQAPAGEINVLAAENWQDSPLRLPGVTFKKDNSRILMESGTVVDVSGLNNLLLPFQRNQLKAQFFSVELADSPLQRTSVVYRQTVMADARGKVELGDASGYYKNLRYTAAEMSTAGGLTRLLSQGVLLQDPNARVDIGGGRVTYDAGSLISSVLIRNGIALKANEASANELYDAFLADPTRATEEELARFGLSSALFSRTTNVDSQAVGKSAGAAVMGAPTQSLAAQVDGSVFMSDVQRASGRSAGIDPGLTAMLTPGEPSRSPEWLRMDELRAANRTVQLPTALTTDSPHLFTSLKPTAGQLFVGLELGADSATRALGNLVGAVRVSASVAAPRVAADLSKEAYQSLLSSLSAGSVLDAGLLQRSGLGSVSLYADNIQFGQVGVDAPRLQLAADGGFLAKARAGDVTINGQIIAPGGKIDVTAQGGDLLLTAGSRLDASGTRSDDRFAGASGAAPALKGGSVSLKAASDIELAAGSEVDVSGAAWRGPNGRLVRGRAGTLTLKVNDGASSASALPTGELKLNGTLSGFDFTGGGTLKLQGLPQVVLGGTRSGAFSLSTSLYADRGFGSLDVASLGQLDVIDGTVVRPELRNLLALSVAVGQQTGVTTGIGVLPAGTRSGLNLRLAAETTPSSPTLFGLSKGADLNVGQRAVLDVGLGGSIDLEAGGSLSVAGSLLAQGGTVSLELRGGRGSTDTTNKETFGYVKDQAIKLLSGSLIDVSGAVKAVAEPSLVARLQGLADPLVGEVLAGGTVNIGGTLGLPTRGQFWMDSGATIKLNGASGLLSPGATAQAQRISSAAGTLNINSTDGFRLQGTVEAKAPDASVGGGTLNIALTRNGTVDSPPAGAANYPTDGGTRTIRIAQDADTLSDLDGKRLFGEGVMSAALVNSSGFDNVSLRADEAIQLNRGVNLKADDGRTRLQSISLDAPVLSLTGDFAPKASAASDAQPQAVQPAQPDHIIQAHHVAMGPLTRSAANAAVPASERVLSGTRSLQVQAGLIEVRGDTAVQGANRVGLSATLGRSAAASFDRLNGEIRFIGQRPVSAALNGDRSMKGRLSFNGQLDLTAGQVYATTLSDYAVVGAGLASTLTLNAPAGGSTSQTPLSALASLKLKATDVTLNGTVRQPVGTIEVEADRLTLGQNAQLSVSAAGVTVPVGTTVNNTRWVYSSQGGEGGEAPLADNVVQDLTERTLNKQITLNGVKTLKVSNTSLLEAQAGGDLLAWQFNPGVGGSTDTFNRPGVFAILPGYGYDFAPFDSEIRARTERAGSNLRAGDQVTVQTPNGVLAAGTYTLLDARYGILPGAVLVSATTLNVTRALPEAIRNDDGSVVVSGYRTRTGTAENGGNNSRQALVLEPESAFRPKSEIRLTSINAFQDARAATSGASLARAAEAGRISMSAGAAFDWQARFNLKGEGTFGAGEFDLAMPDMVVRREAPAAGQVTQVDSLDENGKPIQRTAGVVGMAQLEGMGASSIMLGGTRSTRADGSVQVDRKAAVVAFEAGPAGTDTLRTAGEITAVGTERVSVADGVSIVSTGADDGVSRRMAVQKDGALLQVGHRKGTEVTVEKATAGSTSSLLLGQKTAGGAPVTLKGNAVQIDSTGRTVLGDNLAIDTKALGLGSGSVVVGEAAQPVSDALQVKGELLNQLNKLERLNLRASTGRLALAAGTQLGGDQTRRITLDAPQIQGVAAKDAVAGQPPVVSRVSAQEVVLRNGSGVTASETLKGVGTLLVEARPASTDGRTGGVTFEGNQDKSGSQASSQRLAFGDVQVRSTGDIVFSGKGRTTAQDSLTLDAGRVTATANAQQQVKADGALQVTRSNNTRTLNESLGAGGQLRLEGQTLNQAGNIDVEAGRVQLVARGNAATTSADTTLTLAEGSRTSVAGRLRQVTDTYAVASGGGQILAESLKGSMVVEGTLSAAAPVFGDKVSGENPGAGSINLKATAGEVQMGQKARLDVSGASGPSGSVNIDAASLVLTEAAREAASKNAALAQNGLDQLVAASRNADGSGLGAFEVRQRTGSLDLNTQVKAALVALTADKGQLSLGKAADIDAKTASGGVVQLQAGQDLVLNDDAKIDASSTREGANGGDVLLASRDGTIKLGAATVKADSAGDARDGRIVLRAGQTADGKSMKVEALNKATPVTLTAGRVHLEGVRVYEGATTLGTGAGSATNLNLNELVTQASNFASTDNQAAVKDKLGLGAASNASLRAGVEVRAADGFTITNDLQIAAATRPLNLTVRAKGNIDVNGTVSAGFSGVSTGTASAGGATVAAGEGASLRFVAGADVDSANVNATQADSSTGHLTVAAEKVIRTTTGSIDARASGDVRLMAPTTARTSAIYVTGGELAKDPTEVFAIENTTQAINRTTGATNGAYRFASFTERGERLTVAAGGQVGSFVSVNTVDGVRTYVQQQLTQGSGNYFYHGGNPVGLITQRVPVAWWAGFNEFRQGFGSFGGGNVSVTAGGSVSNVAVVAPTNARRVLNVDSSGAVTSKTLKVLNGGDVSVQAGGDIVGGLYFLGRGQGRLSAGGSLTVGADGLADGATPSDSQVSDPGAMLALMDGTWSINALGDVNISHAYNPTAVPFRFTGQGNLNGTTGATSTPSGLSSTQAAVFYTYADQAGVSAQSLQGNVNLAPNAQNFNKLHSLSSVGALKLAQAQVGSDASVPASVLPPVLSLVSLSGDVLIDTAGRFTTGTTATNGNAGSRLFVMPSAQSDVNVYAGQDLRLRANLQLLDNEQVQRGLPRVTSTTDKLAFFPTTVGDAGEGKDAVQNFASLVTALGGGASLNESIDNDEKSNALRLSSNIFSSQTGVNPKLSNLVPLKEDLGQAGNDKLVRFHAERDVRFEQVSAKLGTLSLDLNTFLRSNRPTELVAGRDVLDPNVLLQNFDASDVSRVAAGRDIAGVQVALGSTPRTIAFSGPGLGEVEAGRDVNLNQMSGVIALGNLLNNALPATSAKLSITAGSASGVNVPELRARHGNTPGLRASVNLALEQSGLSPAGGGKWSALSDDEAFAAFAELTQTRQLEAVQTFLDAAFAAQYLPGEVRNLPNGQPDAAHYRSSAFQRKKQETMWTQIQVAADAAGAIAVSTDATEEASRKLRRQALFNAAEAVADLAGLGRSLVREGDVNVGQSRVHNLGQGGGSTLGAADGALGGIDVVAGGQVVAGLTLPPGAKPGGFINYAGGSFRSISQGDFLAGDQKVISLGRGDLLIYSVAGSIDSGKGSNTSAAITLPTRRFNTTTGQVETVAEPPTSGSGFQKVQTPADYTPVFGLYAPNGEIRALDAFIKGDGNISVITPVVKGGNNIGGASGVASPPPPTVNLSLTPKTADTAAGAREVSTENQAQAKAQANSTLTVDLLGFGDAGAPAAGTAAAEGEGGSNGKRSKEDAGQPNKAP